MMNVTASVANGLFGKQYAMWSCPVMRAGMAIAEFAVGDSTAAMELATTNLYCLSVRLVCSLRLAYMGRRVLEIQACEGNASASMSASRSVAPSACRRSEAASPSASRASCKVRAMAAVSLDSRLPTRALAASA